MPALTTSSNTLLLDDGANGHGPRQNEQHLRKGAASRRGQPDKFSLILDKFVYFTPDCPMHPIIVQPEEGKELCAFGDTILFKIDGSLTGCDLTIGLAITPPGGGPPLHVHHVEHEVFIIESGDLEMNIGGEWKKAAPGSVVFLPRDVPHQFRNVGQTPSRHWVICTPSGFEHFFEKAAAIFAQPGPPDLERVLAAAGEHGMEVLGPPPGAH